MNLEDALSELLPQGRTGEPRADLVSAAGEAWRRRQVNTEAGATVIAALSEQGFTYRQIAEATGIPAATAHRWARPPQQDSGGETPVE
jgi:transposase-like protein